VAFTIKSSENTLSKMITQYNLFDGSGINTDRINDQVVAQLKSKGHQIVHNLKRQNLVSRIQGLILPAEGSMTYIIESRKQDAMYRTVISPGLLAGDLKILSHESLSTDKKDYGFPQNITQKRFYGELK